MEYLFSAYEDPWDVAAEGHQDSIGKTLMTERKTGTSHPGLHVRDNLYKKGT